MTISIDRTERLLEASYAFSLYGSETLRDFWIAPCEYYILLELHF